MIRRGRMVEKVLERTTSRRSALGCYIVAQRAGRDDLARRFSAAAAAQHRSCPLYQVASATFIPLDLYPCDRLASESEQQVRDRLVSLTKFGKFRESSPN